MNIDVLFPIFATSWIVGLSGAVSPGPLLAYDIKESLRIGPWAGPAISLGHSILELGVVALLYFGAATILDSDVAQICISIIGGAVLIFMAATFIRNSSKHSEINTIPNKSYFDKMGPVIGGVIVTVSNPYWSVWWVTVGLAYLIWSQEYGLVGVACFYFGHILADFAWFSLVSIIIASGRKLIVGKIYKIILVLCGVGMGGMGIYFFIRGINLI
ncbi:MAG: LysE family transporter [Chloroflexota bacterium]|jgi:threonine/homoserine/homoserine lactone efflux protein